MGRSAYTPPSNSKFYWLTWFEGCSMEIMALQISILRHILLWYFKMRWESLISHTQPTQLHICTANSRLPLATACSSCSAAVKSNCAPYLSFSKSSKTVQWFRAVHQLAGQFKPGLTEEITWNHAEDFPLAVTWIWVIPPLATWWFHKTRKNFISFTLTQFCQFWLALVNRVKSK